MNTAVAFLLTLCLAVVWASSPSTDCQNYPGLSKKYAAKRLGDKCYVMFYDTYREYHEADNYCRFYKGTLAMPKTSQINVLLTNLLRQNMQDIDSPQTWIGLNDRDTEDEYVWADGTKLNQSLFSNWDDDEGPRAHGFVQHNFEDCVIMDTSGSWRDLHCKGSVFILIARAFETKNFVCELPIKDNSK